MHNFTLTEVGIFKVEWLKFCMTDAMLQLQLGRLLKVLLWFFFFFFLENQVLLWFNKRFGWEFSLYQKLIYKRKEK